MATVKYLSAAAFRNTYFGDDGLALINGTLTSLKASDHSCKIALYESNITPPGGTTPPAYSNPIDLDSGGSIPAPSSLFYSDEFPYYLELRDSNGVLVQSIEPWPPASSDPTPPADEVDITNFIANSDFTEQLKPEFLNDELGTTATKIAPPEWYFIRSNTSATLTVSFDKFILGQTDVPDNPYSYLDYNCSVAGSGETFTAVYHRIKDVRSFEGQDIVIDFYAKSSGAKSVEMSVYQDFGAAGSTFVNTIISSVALTTYLAEYSVTVTVPSIAGKTIDPERGELQIRFGMPLDQTSDVQITHVKVNKGTIPLEYQYLPERFATGKNYMIELPPKPPVIYYDNAGISIPYDWVSKYTTDRGYIWESPELVGQMTSYPVEVEADYWLSLCRVPGAQYAYSASYPRLFEVIGGKYGSRLTSATVLTDTVTVTNLVNGVVADAAAVTSGFTINVTQQGTAVLPEIFTIQTLAASALTPGTYLTFTSLLPAPTTVDYAIWISIDGVGLPPLALAPGRDILELKLSSTNTADEVAANLGYMMNPLAFILPFRNGYFDRGWDNGHGKDPDAATRTDRGDGTVGDHVGTIQTNDYKAHSHLVNANNTAGITSIPTNNYLADARDSFPGAADIYHSAIGAPVTMNAAMIANSPAIGGAETRGVNKSVHYLIKY